MNPLLWLFSVLTELRDNRSRPLQPAPLALAGLIAGLVLLGAGAPGPATRIAADVQVAAKPLTTPSLASHDVYMGWPELNERELRIVPLPARARRRSLIPPGSPAPGA